MDDGNLCLVRRGSEKFFNRIETKTRPTNVISDDRAVMNEQGERIRVVMFWNCSKIRFPPLGTAVATG